LSIFAPLSRRQGQPGFAAATWTGDSDQTAGGQQASHVGEFALAADETR
jgi:hypothetical protein